jgi:hypothetical protein
MTTVNATYVTAISVTDPDTGGKVDVEIWKDPSSDGIFGIDASFLDQVSESIASPYNPGVMLKLPSEEVK